MDNKNISTKLGVVIIVIFAVTALAFVLVYEKNKKISEVKNNVAITVQESTQPENKRKEEAEKTEPDSPSGKYTSIDNVIEFQYRTDGNPIFEKDGTIQFLPLVDKVLNNQYYSYLKDYSIFNFNEKKYAVMPILSGKNNPDEGIIIFDKKENETLEDAIKKLIRQQGKNPANCKVVKEQNGEKEKAWIELAREYNPTEEELMKHSNSPEHFRKWIAVGAKTAELCSIFSPPSTPGLSIFEYDSAKNKRKFIFEKLRGYDGNINYYSIKFIPQK
jgi:ribosomal protein S16